MSKEAIAKKIDSKKASLEVALQPKFEAIFEQLATDCYNLYIDNGYVDAKEISENYKPEFLKEIRDGYRKSITTFGFNGTQQLEKRFSIKTNFEKGKSFLDLLLENDFLVEDSIEIDDEKIDDKISDINNQFQVDSTVFVANQSEEKNEYITQSNENMIEKAVVVAVATYAATLGAKEEEKESLLLDQLFEEDQRELTRINQEIEELRNNANNIIAEDMRVELLDISEERSKVIAEDTIGTSESWARQEKAELINAAYIETEDGYFLETDKEWDSILDDKTREAHAEAHGQTVGVDEYFDVGGELLIAPRDPSGSIGNTINCRCVAQYKVRKVLIEN